MDWTMEMLTQQIDMNVKWISTEMEYIDIIFKKVVSTMITLTTTCLFLNKKILL